MPLAQVKVARIVAGEWDWLGPPRPGLRRWERRGPPVRPAPASPYRQATGYEQFRRKVVTGRPFSYRAAMDRPFPDPGLGVGLARVRMLPPVNPWGRYTVPHPGRRALLQPFYPVSIVQFPDRPTLSEATGYYTASEEALGLGDPGFFKKVFRGAKKVVRKVVAPVLRIAAPLAMFIPGVGPLAAAAIAAGGSITGQMLGARKPLKIFRKPLRVFGEAAAAGGVAGVGKFAIGMLRRDGTFAPTGNVPTAEVLREAGLPPPVPAIGWGEVAQTVGQVATAALPVASQLLQRYLPGTPGEAPDPRIMDGGWGTPVYDPSGQPRYLPGPAPGEGAYVPGSAGSPGSPAEAGPAIAPEMVQPAGMFGGPMMMPLLIVGGVVALLAANR